MRCQHQRHVNVARQPFWLLGPSSPRERGAGEAAPRLRAPVAPTRYTRSLFFGTRAERCPPEPAVPTGWRGARHFPSPRHRHLRGCSGPSLLAKFRWILQTPPASPGQRGSPDAVLHVSVHLFSCSPGTARGNRAQQVGAVCAWGGQPAGTTGPVRLPWVSPRLAKPVGKKKKRKKRKKKKRRRREVEKTKRRKEKREKEEKGKKREKRKKEEGRRKMKTTAKRKREEGKGKKARVPLSDPGWPQRGGTGLSAELDPAPLARAPNNLTGARTRRERCRVRGAGASVGAARRLWGCAVRDPPPPGCPVSLPGGRVGEGGMQPRAAFLPVLWQ